MLSSTIAANINGHLPPNHQVVRGSYSSAVLTSSVDFNHTVKDNTSAELRTNKCLNQLNNKGGSGRSGNASYKAAGILDQNKNYPVKNHTAMNGSKLGDGVPVPQVQLFQPGRINLEWRHVNEIGAGLSNCGNTCFINSVLQCLTYCPPLANYLLDDNSHMEKCLLPKFCMMCELQVHMKRAMGRQGQSIIPINICNKLNYIAKHLHLGCQEDAHEFLRCLIEKLWKSCITNYNGQGKLDPASKETTVINHIFGGYHRSQVTCLSCDGKSMTYDHFMDFALDVRQGVSSLGEALQQFIQPELLQHENSYKCPYCNVMVTAQKKFSIHRAPNVATFQFKRFDFHKSPVGKISKFIYYPEHLDLRPYMSESKGPRVMYKLNAVLVHSGVNCNSGHYTCYVKNSNGYWYLMDDDRVKHTTLEDVLHKEAYVLFYIRVKNVENVNLKRPLENAAINRRNSPVMKTGVSRFSGHETPSAAMSHPSQNLKTSSTTSLPNGTANHVKRKSSLQNKEDPHVVSFCSKQSKKENRSGDLPPSKSNTLVPCPADSTDDEDAQKEAENTQSTCKESQKQTASTSVDSVSSECEASVSSDSSPECNPKFKNTYFNTAKKKVTSLSTFSSCTTSVASTTDWNITDQENVSRFTLRKYTGWGVQKMGTSAKAIFDKLLSKRPEPAGPPSELPQSADTKKSESFNISSVSFSFVQAYNQYVQKSSESSEFTEEPASSDCVKDKASADRTAVQSSSQPFLVHSDPQKRTECEPHAFKTSKSFRVDKRDEKESGETLCQPLKRPLSELCKDGSDSRNSNKHSDSSQNSDTSLFKRNKKKKIDNKRDEMSEEYFTANSSLSIDRTKPCVAQQNSSVTDPESDKWSDSGYEYEWVEKTKESMEMEISSCNGATVPLDMDFQKENRQRPLKHCEYDDEIDGGKKRRTRKHHRESFRHPYNPFQHAQTRKNKSRTYSSDEFSSKQLKKKYFKSHKVWYKGRSCWGDYNKTVGKRGIF